ncbi:hypothetical protein FGB62_2g58 [Gracilaria domingensis]|nr:hypothetical protein FGB62_2g58 [Gracilaria domingensis]
MVRSKMACGHLGSNQVSTLNKVMTYLNASASAAKDSARNEARRKRLLEMEFENERLSDEIFQKKTRLATRKFADILRTAEKHAQGHRGSFMDRLKSNDALLRNRCINFRALFVLTGGGERSQAYATLQAPSAVERQKDIETDFGIFFSMRTNLNEKTNFNLSFLVVLFPKVVLTLKVRRISCESHSAVSSCEVQAKPGSGGQQASISCGGWWWSFGEFFNTNG